MGKGNSSSNESLLDKLGENPLYIIDGKKYTAKELNGKYLDISGQGISISLAEQAKAQFGDQAKDGAIIADNARIFDDLQKELKIINKENSETKRKFMQIEQGKRPSLISLRTKFRDKKKTKDEKLEQVSKNNQKIPGNPVYILNGEKSKKEIIDLIDPNLIKSVNVLKGENAISLYGKEAKDGAVIITTKVLDKSEKKVIKTKAQSVGFQTFKRKTHYKIMSNNSFSYSGEDINAFQKFEKKSDSDEITGYEVKAKIFTNGVAQTSPLVIIDGEKKTAEFKKKELQPEDIEKINVVKGKNAIEKYGEEAEDGVIEITTKKETKE